MHSKNVFDKTDLLNALCLLILCIPYSVGVLPWLATGVKLAKWAVFIYVIVLLMKREKKIDIFNLLIFIYFVITLFAVAINAQSVYQWFSKSYPWISATVITQYAIDRNPKFIIKVLAVLFFGLVFGNYISWLIVGPSQLYLSEGAFYFLGIRTRISDVAFVAIAFFLINIITNGKRKGILLLFGGVVSIVAFSYLEWVSTALLSLVMYIGLFLFSLKYYKRYTKICRILLVGSLVISFLLVFLKIQNLFDWLLVDILEEDLTLDGRSYIWDSLIQQIKGIYWFIGHGLNNGAEFKIKNSATVAAHNQYLSILFNHGIFGLLIFMAIPLHLFKVRSKDTHPVIFGIFSATIIVYFISGIAEITCESTYYYILLGAMNRAHKLQVPHMIKTKTRIHGTSNNR